MIIISRALSSLYPNAEYIMENEDYEKIRWTKNQPDPLPTLEHLQNELARLEAEDIKMKYQQQRRNEYPPLADLADALYWQAQGDNSKMETYIARVALIKNKYPKGTE